MEANKMNELYKWMWWEKGECVVKILRTGHFPTSVEVQLPNDHITEIETSELVMPQQRI
jgi:hypothetical protein